MNPIEHMVLPRISWSTFTRVMDDIGERHFRMAYLNGELEFMKVELGHSQYGRWIGNLIFFAALQMRVSICSGGSTTLFSEHRKVGIEPDECFWTKHEKKMRRKKKWRASDDPPPDLAVEIDITSGWLDRLSIYATLKVPEVWRFDGKTFTVFILNSNCKYKQRNKSLAFPSLPMGSFVGFVKKLGGTDEITLIQEFTEWLRTEVAGKKRSGKRKNGRS